MEKHFINVKYTDKQLKEFKSAWLNKYDRKEPEHGLLRPGMPVPTEAQNLQKALVTEGPNIPFLPPKDDREEQERRRIRTDEYNSIKRKMDALNLIRTMWMFARPHVPSRAALYVDNLIKAVYRILQIQVRERMAPQMMAQLDLLEETARRQMEVEEVLKLNITGKDDEFIEASSMYRNKYNVTTNLWNYNENLKQQLAIQTNSSYKGQNTPALVPDNFDLNENLEEYYQKLAEKYYMPIRGHSNVVPNFIANSNTSINNNESVIEKAELSNHVEVDTTSKRLGRVVIDNDSEEINNRNAAICMEEEYTRPTNVTQTLLPPENAIHKQEMDLEQNDEYFPTKDKLPLDPNSKYPFEVTEPEEGYPNVGKITPLEPIETIPIATETIPSTTGDPQIDEKLQTSQGDNTLYSRQIRSDNSQSIFPGFITNFLNYKTNSKDLVTEITKIPGDNKTHIYDLTFLDLIEGHKYAHEELMKEKEYQEILKHHEANRLKMTQHVLKTPSKLYDLGKYIVSKIYERTTSQLSKETEKISNLAKVAATVGEKVGDVSLSTLKSLSEIALKKPKTFKNGLTMEDLSRIMNKMKKDEQRREQNKETLSEPIMSVLPDGGLLDMSTWIKTLLDEIPSDLMGPEMEDLKNVKDYLSNYLTKISPENKPTIETVIEKKQDDNKVINNIETLTVENLVVDDQLTSIKQPVTEEDKTKPPIQKIDITKYFPVFKDAKCEKILKAIPVVKAEINKEEKLPDLNPAYNNILVHNAVLEKQLMSYPDFQLPNFVLIDKEEKQVTEKPGFFKDWNDVNTQSQDQEIAYAEKEAQLKQEAGEDWWKPIIEEEYNLLSEFEELPYTKEDLYTLAELIINDPKIYYTRKYDAFNYVRNSWKKEIAGINKNKLNRIIVDQFAERPSDSQKSIAEVLNDLWKYGGVAAAYKGTKFLARLFFRSNLQGNQVANIKGMGVKGEGICNCGSRKNLLVHDKMAEDYTCEKCYHKAGKLTNRRFTDKTANIIPLSFSKHPKHKQAFQSNLELENYERLANSNIPTAYDNFFDNPVDRKFINRINSGLLIGRGMKDSDHRYIAHAMGVNEHAPEMLNHYGKQNLAMMITKLLHAQQQKPKRAINMHNLAKVSTLEKELRENPKLLEHYTV